ncbi:MAG: energy-coupling factor transporter transmembrane protein EcfT [Actinomycetia bacterium]|nr:energy-coupling factor transporter transmembrane protein EcfT [Actinomycetes bacterium]
MAAVMPFGNYIDADTPLHRLDTRLKLLLLVGYVTGLFLVDHWLGLALFCALLLAAYLTARVPLAFALRGLVPLAVILVFVLLANGFSFSLDPLALPSAQSGVSLIGSFGLLPLGLLRGCFLVVRIVALFSAASLLTYTSSLVQLSDALVSLLRPLAVLRLPTEDIAMMFSIALRFIPLTASEAERIMVAQQARGAVFDRGGPLRRARAWLPVLVPLFVKLFRRADRLAAAMEARCYAGKGRTHLRAQTLRASRVLLALLSAAALVVLGVWL